MVGVNLYIHQIGTVAIFATLFVATCVNGEKGHVFNFENTADFDLECNEVKNAWKVNPDNAEKVLALTPEQEGCLRTKLPVVLNSTSRVILRFFREDADEKNEKFTLSLKPREGTCPDEECVWNVASDAQNKPGNWVTAEYKFPLKSAREYYIQVNVDKNKGKFFLDHISIPNAVAVRKKSADDSEGVQVQGKFFPAQESTTTKKPSTNGAVSLAEISKNLLITSASVLTLNLLN